MGKAISIANSTISKWPFNTPNIPDAHQNIDDWNPPSDSDLCEVRGENETMEVGVSPGPTNIRIVNRYVWQFRFTGEVGLLSPAMKFELVVNGTIRSTVNVEMLSTPIINRQVSFEGLNIPGDTWRTTRSIRMTAIKQAGFKPPPIPESQ